MDAVSIFEIIHGAKKRKEDVTKNHTLFFYVFVSTLHIHVSFSMVR
ncbi:hypothetical protein B879_02451 [Cecembia lonarensis LW9]|uniref:Uncharacterized protein n=1 Tax=Cecembia lonarensis (strain CCUG 58316 / KCTC 22772 / LW9) TaxID=1225176 RepID=K1L9R6_CECL9|nr:hypothetical protein B879_02451 [Cecembia lonarensis LW9]